MVLNDAMRVYLTRAAEEEARGKPVSDAQLTSMVMASFRFEADGFKRKTIWRALELATDFHAEVSTAADQAEGDTSGDEGR